jgi:large repetitive protein
VPAGANPAPGQLMLLSDGAATLELAVVTGIRLTVNCDRPWTGAASGLQAIPIADGGSTYPAASVGVAGTLTLTLGNTLGAAAGPIVTELPRMGVGELVKLAWTDGGVAFSDIFSVSAVEALSSGGVVVVDSTTITLVGGRITPSPTATGFTVTRQVPGSTAANSGTTREALNGEVLPVPAGGTNPQMRFAVWTVGSLSTGPFAVTDGTTTLPMVFAAPTAALPGLLEIQLGAAPTAFKAASTPTLRVPKLAVPPASPALPPTFASVVYAATFTQTGNVLNFTVHPDEPSILAPGTGNIVVAVSFGTAATAGTPAMIATAVSGTVQPGTVLIPQDTSYELTVKEGLIEHETRHTMQYSWLGPIMWGFLPILPLLDKVYPGLDSADYSPYFDGELIQGAGEGTLQLSNFGTTPLTAGDQVAASLNIPFTLGKKTEVANAPAGSVSFLISDTDFQKLRSVADSSGKLPMRKVLHGTGGHAANVLLRDIPVFLTPGGLTEFTISSTWGWFVYGIVRLFYALHNRMQGTSGTTYDGKVSADGKAIVVDDPVYRTALEGVSRILVQHGKSTVIRTVESGMVNDPEALTMTLTEALETLKGQDVQVAPYDTHQPASSWDWNHYYPAKVPDDKKPATITIEPGDTAGKDKLTLKLQDRVLIRTGTASTTTVVTAVNADGSVDLEAPPLLELAGGGPDGGGAPLDKEFRIAKVGEHDPLGSLGGFFANLQRAPWLGKLVDPWAWVTSLPNVKPGSGGEWAMRVMRWIGSSHVWSMAFPGVLWVDDLFKGSGSFSAWMEQDASENSGDLYTSLGRLEHAPSLVGDIGRYWFFPNGRFLSEYMTVVGGSRVSRAFERAGSQINREGVVAPFVTPEVSGGAATINKGAGAPVPSGAPPAPGAPLPVGAGDAMPDALYAKNGADPRQPSGVPLAFVPNDRGLIPVTGALERTEGTYVAYTRPGTHRATIIESFLAGGTLTNEISNARSVVDTGAGFGLKDVKLFFDRTIADVTVTVDGVPVANDGTVTLVLTQAARVAVTPVDAARRYALTLQRPITGTLLQADQVGNDPAIIQALAPSPLPAVVSEPVELCRIYRFDAASNAFDEPSLNVFKMSLPGDLRIPVRRFTVAVTNTITARSKVSISSADDVSSMVPGTDVFVLVPASIAVPLSAAISYNAPAPPGTKDPVVLASAVAIPADLVSAGVVGTAFSVHCDQADPPELPATLTLSVGVGAGGLSATLTGTLTLNPAFVLDAPGNAFTVARGATLVLTANDLALPANNVNVSAVDPLADVTIAVSNAAVTLTVLATATPGARRVIATLQSDASGLTKAARTITIT